MISFWVLGVIYLAPSSLRPLFLILNPLSAGSVINLPLPQLHDWWHGYYPHMGVPCLEEEWGLGIRPCHCPYYEEVTGLREGLQRGLTSYFTLGVDVASHLTISHMWVDNQGRKVLRSHSSHLSVCLWDVFPMNPCCVLMKVYPHWKFTEIRLQSHI